MKKYILSPIVFAFILSCGSETEETQDNILVPQDSANVASDTLSEFTDETATYETIEEYITILSKAELYDLFDEADLEDSESWYGEGSMKYDVTWLTNPVNGDKVKYVLDEENSEEVIFVEFFHTLYNNEFEVTGTQEILSNTGIYTGMSFEELKTWNEGPFEFSGFGWDFAGGIMPEQGSKIETNP